MATGIESGAEPAIEESIANDIIDSIKQSGGRNVEILMMGKTGSGKTTLASALISNQSSGGSFGPTKGTFKLFSSKQLKLTANSEDTTITVHDITGLEDPYIPEKDIVEAIHQSCKVSELLAIILCLKFSERFDRSHERILKVVNDLGGDVWKKVVVALTFCDDLSPEVLEMKQKEKTTKLELTLKHWQSYLKNGILHLENSPDESVVMSMPIVPTTHTKVKLSKSFHCLFMKNVSNWLENLWLIIIHNFAQYQPKEDIIKILTLLVSFFQHRFKSSTKMTVEDVRKHLTPAKVAGLFLSTLLPGGVMGSISGILLGEIITAILGLTVVGGVATAVSGGVFAGVCIGAGAAAAIVIVIIYCIHRYRERERKLKRIRPLEEQYLTDS